MIVGAVQVKYVPKGFHSSVSSVIFAAVHNVIYTMEGMSYYIMFAVEAVIYIITMVAPVCIAMAIIVAFIHDLYSHHEWRVLHAAYGGHGLLQCFM